MENSPESGVMLLWYGLKVVVAVTLLVTAGVTGCRSTPLLLLFPTNILLLPNKEDTGYSPSVLRAEESIERCVVGLLERLNTDGDGRKR